MKTIKFQTGRHYTEHGQRIAAALLDDGRIYFVDVDRDIDGILSADAADILEFGLFSRRDILSMYDAGQYGGGRHAISDDFDAGSDIARTVRELALTL